MSFGSQVSCITLCRTIDGLKPLVRLLEMASAQGVIAAALDALRAASMNNDDNKAAAASCWLVPQLVKLIGSEVSGRHSHFPAVLPVATMLLM